MDLLELPFIMEEFNGDLTTASLTSNSTCINSNVNPLCTTTTTQSVPSLSKNFAPNSHQMNRGLLLSVSQTVKTELESNQTNLSNLVGSIKLEVNGENSDDEYYRAVGSQLSTDSQVVDGDGPRGQSQTFVYKAAPKTKFKCDFAGCYKEFKRKDRWTSHTRGHTGEKPFPCPWNGCDKSFANKRGMDQHLKVHTNRLQCPWIGCDKTFVQDAALQVHIRMHTGERPFICNLDNCWRSFARQGDLIRHYNQMHNRQ